MELLMPDTPTNKRLDRIEEKLDQMGEVLVSLARFEEKMDAYNEYRERSWERMNKFSEKLDRIEKCTEKNTHTTGTINRIMWIIIVALVGSIVSSTMY